MQEWVRTMAGGTWSRQRRIRGDVFRVEVGAAHRFRIGLHDRLLGSQPLLNDRVPDLQADGLRESPRLGELLRCDRLVGQEDLFQGPLPVRPFVLASLADVVLAFPLGVGQAKHGLCQFIEQTLRLRSDTRPWRTCERGR